MKIFVSHAPADLALAKALVECLAGCLELQEGDLRCSSVPGHKLPASVDVAQTLKAEFPAPGAVVGLISPSALSAGGVLFEVGTAWGAGKRLFPLLTQGVDLGTIPSPLVSEDAVRPFDAAEMHRLMDALSAVTGVRQRREEVLQAAIDEFVKGQPSYSAAQAALDLGRAAKKGSEPYFDGFSYSELIQALEGLEIMVPADVAKSENPVRSNALQLFVHNADLFTQGLVSAWDPEKGGGFLYHQVALKLLPYRLVQFDKLHPPRSYKQISLSPMGDKFIAYWNTQEARKKSG
ncbi:toll/interleukin-1 receptor domain-containing protein [Chondromyces crocatus]|uniref:TIR domain-containing protein n=1 Tax=Chondromyces crocatus TaxID=52 RepID=A0A0K1E8X4_CHOCO|nr:toll/interleukin-1 receptor domain-containing protein [Chondromyces crocatus]AKT37331.1 uncharacterized protein CMC5_014640 [Chondromyces crocatus]